MEARTVINIQDPIGKTVGKRRPPRDPFDLRYSNRLRAVASKSALPYRSPKSGVYRFQSHEEANQWMMQMLGPVKENLLTPPVK